MDITRWPDLDGIQNAPLEGYLVKGTRMRTKKRYFVLDGVALQYFTNDAMTDIKGEVDIRDAQISLFSGRAGKGYVVVVVAAVVTLVVGAVALSLFVLVGRRVSQLPLSLPVLL